jgi:1,4-dihydroxy-2-naphthoyl-CoA hydrolase
MARIWRVPVTTEILNKRNEGSLADFFGIVFTEVGDDFLIARMPVTSRHLQPEGIMHGGVSCVLAETVGSVGANYCVDSDEKYCVGLDINTNHITPIKAGDIIALGKPFHLGRSTQVWSIEIRDEKSKLISVTRLTLMNIDKR